MCRLMTPRLEEALEGYPLYSQDGKGKEAVCRAIFALGAVRWFILEGEREGNDTILFGIVVGLAEDEYGYISLNELSEVELDLTAQDLGKLQVRQQENFTPEAYCTVWLQFQTLMLGYYDVEGNLLSNC